MRLEDSDVGVLRAQDGVEEVRDTKRLELGGGWVVRESGQLQTARSARVQEFDETAVRTAGKNRERFLFHPPFHARGDRRAIAAGPLADHSDLRSRHIAGETRPKMFLGLPVGLERAERAPSARGIHGRRAEQSEEHGATERRLTVQGTVHVEDDSLQSIAVQGQDAPLTG